MKYVEDFDKNSAALARWLGMSPPAAAALVDGRNRPSLETTITVAEKLGVSEYELRTGVKLDRAALELVRLQDQVRVLTGSLDRAHQDVERAQQNVAELEADLKKARLERGIALAELEVLKNLVAELKQRAEHHPLPDESPSDNLASQAPRKPNATKGRRA